MSHLHIKSFLRFLAVAAVALLVLSCPSPLNSPSPDPSAKSDSREGSLTITVRDAIDARTLVPAISMTAASYTVVGVGPSGSGATFTKPITGTLTVTNLVPGTWTVTVNAWNAANGTGTMIGNGTQTTTVSPAQVTGLAITVAPLTGNGTLSLQSSWSGFDVSSILASVKHTVTHNQTNLAFSINSANNTATLPITSMPTGYYELSLQLLNGASQVVMGARDVVRIVSGQPTSGSFSFTATPGQVVVIVTPTPNNPIVLGSITGIPAPIRPATDLTANVVATDNTANAAYTWSLNGVPLPVSEDQTYPTTTSCRYHLGTLDPGYYRLDVTAITSDGTRAGSQSASFVVTPSAPYITALLATRTDGGSASSMQLVSVRTSADGDPIEGATVTVNNSAPFTYTGNNPPPGTPSQAYVGNAAMPAGAAITLSVIVNGGNYTATATQFATLPVLLLPTPSTTWSAGSANTIKWNTPIANAHYIVGIQADTGDWVFGSLTGGPLEGPVVSSPITLTVPANTLTASVNYTLTLATLNGEVQFDNDGRILVTGGTAIPTAQPGSTMVYGAGMMVPITPTP